MQKVLHKYYELTKQTENLSVSNEDSPNDDSKDNSVPRCRTKPVISTKRRPLTYGLLIFTLVLIIFMWIPQQISLRTLNDHLIDFPDITSIHGKHKEAYGFLLCTRPEGDHELQMNYEALKVSIYRLQKIQENKKIQRDVIVAVCQHTTQSQYHSLKNLNIILIPVRTINPPSTVLYKRWIDNYTKFVFWKMINWDRILVMDIDIYFTKDFVDVWDEPASQIKHSPPSEYLGSDNTYLGYKIQDLYPYVHAATIDNSNWEKWLKVGKFNAGFYVMKPNLIHYDLLTDIAFNSSIHFEEMEQSCLNYVYNRTGAIPWSYFDELYNYFPHNGKNSSIKAYHAKLWQDNPPVQYEHLLHLFYDSYEQVKLHYPEIAIKSSKVFVAYESNFITISDLELTERGIVYAVASTNTTETIYSSQIRYNTDANGSHLPGTYSLYNDRPISLTISGLVPNTMYNIYYLACSPNNSLISDIYYIESSTRLIDSRYIFVIKLSFAIIFLYFCIRKFKA